MRRMLLAVGLLAIGVSTSAQAPSANRLGLRSYSAKHMERNGSVVHLSGGAFVWVGNATITADEAFVNFEREEVEIEFRGTVRMEASPTRK